MYSSALFNYTLRRTNMEKDASANANADVDMNVDVEEWEYEYMPNLKC